MNEGLARSWAGVLSAAWMLLNLPGVAAAQVSGGGDATVRELTADVRSAAAELSATPQSPVHTGQLRQGQSREFPLALPEGRCIVVIARSENSLTEIDASAKVGRRVLARQGSGEAVDEARFCRRDDPELEQTLENGIEASLRVVALRGNGHFAVAAFVLPEGPAAAAGEAGGTADGPQEAPPVTPNRQVLAWRAFTERLSPAVRAFAAWAVLPRGTATAALPALHRVGGGDDDFIARRIRSVHGRLGNGATPVTNVHRGELGTGEQSEVPLAVVGGLCYLVVAAGVPSVRELDLYLLDSFGTERARDDSQDAQPDLRFCPATSGRMTMRVRMFHGYGRYGLQAFAGAP